MSQTAQVGRADGAVTHARANDEMIEAIRERVGKVIRRSDPPFIRHFTAEAIAHFAYGCGDPNPLFYDAGYAAETPFGSIIAPPTILFAQGVGTLMATTFGMPGLHALYMGTEFWFHQPIKAGDVIEPVFRYGDIEIQQNSSKFAGLRIRQTMDGEFRNQRGELVSESKDHVLRFDRYGSERDKYADLKSQYYTPDDIAAIDADYDKEVRRGQLPRYWEDVKLGEPIPWIVKGPLTITDVIAYKIGWGHWPFVRPNRMALEYRRAHPKAFTPNSHGIPDIPERVHWEDELAQTIGVPHAFDYGPQRVSWFSHLLFNWVGDHGWVEYLNVELRAPILIGDTSWFEGEVARTWVEDDRHLVELDLWGRDQRDRRTTKATARVRLPSQANPTTD